MKSAIMPLLFTLSTIASPVKPAANPRAVFSIPRFLRTVETLMPFPQKKQSSDADLFVIPGSSGLSILTI
jgi:hypothetical protein